MNKTLFVLILLVLSASSQAQQYQLDSTVHTIKEHQFIASQKNDVQNRKAQIIRYEREGAHTAIQVLERNLVEYNEYHNTLRSRYGFWNAEIGSWEDQRNTENRYDSEQRVIHVEESVKNDGEWLKELVNTVAYAKDTIRSIDYEQRNDKLQATNKSIKTINPFGKLSLHEVFIWDDAKENLKPYFRKENSYQSDTILVSYESLVWEQGEWQKGEKVEFELDKDGRRTDNYITYSGVDEEYIPVYRFEEIDLPEENRKINRTYRWSASSSGWQASSEVVLFLDEQGKEAGTFYKSINEETKELELSVERNNFYDKQGRLKLYQIIDHTGEKITGTQTRMEFDAEGNVTKEIICELDADNDSWIEKTITEFFFEKNILLNNYDRRDLDFFGLAAQDYDYKDNTYALQKVLIYDLKNGEKILSESFEYFYTTTP